MKREIWSWSKGEINAVPESEVVVTEVKDQ